MLFEDTSTYKVPIPTSAAEFEEICLDLWQAEWNDPHIQRWGRSGQSQDGIDLLSDPPEGPRRAIQCKNYEPKHFTNATVDEIVETVGNASLPLLRELIIVTTARRDAGIQKHIAEIREQHRRNNLFDVWLYSWDDMSSLLQKHPDVLHRHWGSRLLESNGAFQIIGDTFLESAEKLAKNRKFEDALVLVNDFERKQSVMDDGTRYRVLNTQGRLLWKMGRLQDAAGKLIGAYQLNKTDEAARTNAAQAYLSLGDRRVAAEIAREVIVSNPTSVLAYRILLLTTASLQEARECLREVPEAYRSSSHVQFALGLVAGQEQDFAASEDFLRASYENGSGHDATVGAQLAAVILARLMRAAYLSAFTALGVDSKRVASEAEHLLSSAIDSPGEATDEDVTSWHANRCLARQYLSDVVGASGDADYCISAHSEQPGYIKLRAFVQYQSGDNHGALSTLETVSDFSSVPDALGLKVELLESEQRYEDALAAATDLTSLPGRTEAAVSLAEYSRLRLLRKVGRVDEASSLTEQLQCDEPGNPLWPLAAYCSRQPSALTSVETDGTDLLRTTTALAVKDGVSAVVREQVGAVLFGLSKYEFSVAVDQTGVTGDVYDARACRLLRGYLSLGRLAEALQVCGRLIDSGVDDQEVFFYRGQIHNRMGDLASAESDLSKSLEANQGNTDALLLLTETQLRRERSSDARTTLERINDIDQLKPADFQRLVRLWIRLGDYQRALAVAYAILVSSRDRMQPEVYSTYIWSIFALERVAPGIIPEFDTSQEGAGLRVKTETDREARYIIGGGPQQMGSIVLLSLSDPMARCLLGKRVGDVVDLSAGEPGPSHRVTILEVKSKFLALLDVAMELYQTTFPQRHDIEMIPLFRSNESAVISEPMKERIQGMGRFGAYARRLVDMQERGELPFSGLCCLFSRDVVATRLEIASSKGAYVRTDVPGTKPVADGDIFTSLVLDPMSVLTFTLCPALSSGVPSKWQPVYTQSTMDTLRNARLELGLATKDGLHSVASVDGVHLSPSDVTPETVRSWIATVDNAIEWLAKYARQEHYVKVLDLGNDTYESAVLHIGQSEVDSLALAGEVRHVLVSDQLALRKLSSGLNVQARSTQNVLFWMLTDGLISRDNYGMNLLELFRFAMRGIYMDGETITSICTSARWEYKRVPNEIYEMLLPNNMWNEGPLVAGEFASQICRRVANQQERLLAWWPLLLSAVTGGRDPDSAISAMLERARPLLRLLPLAVQELTEFSTGWSRARIPR